ncbi:MAG: DUF2461 domain-containing protein [Bacteroidota bacterium]
MRELLQFLAALEANNHREWFNEHKPTFRAAEEEFKNLVAQVQDGLSEIDHIDTASTKVFRIYRDVRFSENKTPYHLHRSVSFKRATEKLRGGYYLKISKGESIIVGGFFGPSPSDMLHLRRQIQQDPLPLRAIISSKAVTDYFGGLQGEQVKSAPRGFKKEDPAIDLLKYKQMLLKKSFSEAEVTSATFSEKVVEGFSKMRPFFDYMSEILTSDLNGVSSV